MVRQGAPWMLLWWGLVAANPAISQEGGEDRFFQWGGGARPMAMGHTFLAVADDATASFWNPAGLAQLHVPEVHALHAQLYEDTTYEFLAGALPLGAGQGLGLNAFWLTSGAIEGRNELDQPTGAAWTHQKIGITIAYGWAWTDGFRMGVALKHLERSQGSRTTGLTTGDVSFLISPVPQGPLTIGLVAQHLGTFVWGDTEDRLTPNWRAGISLRLGEHGLLSADVHQNGRWHLGAEYQAFLPFHLRAGFNGEGPSAGIGWWVDRLQFDYAAAIHAELGLSHRVSLTVRGGESRP